MKYKTVLVAFVCSLCFISAAQVFAIPPVEGYVINQGEKTVHNTVLSPLSVLPFQQSGQTASQYLATTHFSTDPTSKMVVYTAGTAGTHGCAFMFSADATDYYVAAASLDKDSKCDARVSSSPGFVKKAFLVVTVNS